MGVVSPPGALTATLTGGSINFELGFGAMYLNFNLTSLYMTAVHKKATVTIKGFGASPPYSITSSVIVHLLANTVTYLPMSGFNNLGLVEIVGAVGDKLVIDNVVVQKTPYPQK